MFSYNQKYTDGLTKTYGFHKEYQFKGKKCHKDCKNLIHYETIHSKECPFYEGSYSQRFDCMIDIIASCILHIYKDNEQNNLT